MMKRFFLLLLLSFLPLATFLLVDQVQRYDQLENEVKELQKRQAQLFEENKRTVVNIAILKAPERIDQLAREMGLEKRPREGVLRIELPKKGGSKDG
jgi:cell division protein FtsB